MLVKYITSETMICVQELEEQGRMLGGALTALAAREEALRTAHSMMTSDAYVRVQRACRQAGIPRRCECSAAAAAINCNFRSGVLLSFLQRSVREECASNTASVWITVL
jgi:hypothetical protein